MIERIMLAGLMLLELPGRTIRLCDGGVVPVDGETYVGSDPDFGTLAGFEALTEGVGDEAPSGAITMLPPSSAAAATLSRPEYQNSRLRLYVAELDVDTGLPIGAPDQQADWQTDTTVLRIGRGSRSLEIGCVSRAQRLLAINEGNVLSSAAHQRVFSGETGFDQATGLTNQVAWGEATPPRGVA